MDFDAAQVAQLVSIPAVQIDYLVRAGVVVPAVPAARRGMSRRFSAQNLFEFAVAGELMEAGISIVEIAHALHLLREDAPTIANRRRRSGLMLTLYRRVGSKRKSTQADTPSLIEAADVGDLASKGYTVVYSVPIGYIANVVEKAAGEALPAQVLTDDNDGPAINE